jgi:hypothetical protein
VRRAGGEIVAKYNHGNTHSHLSGCSFQGILEVTDDDVGNLSNGA